MSETTLPKTTFAHIKEITHINHKPHPPMIGPRHVAYASDHCGGLLTEEAFDNGGGCDWQDYRGAPRCGMKMSAHTSNKVAVVALDRDCSNDEMKEWLKSLIPWAEEEKLDGFVFIDTGFRVNPPDEEEDKSCQ